jgi:hypothetical protein
MTPVCISMYHGGGGVRLQFNCFHFACHNFDFFKISTCVFAGAVVCWRFDGCGDAVESMQPYFDVDFHHYAVDRAHLTTSRQRAQLMTVYQRTLRRHSVQLASVALQQDGAEDTWPEPAWKKDKKGLAVCQYSGRHYQDNDEAWAKHKTYNPAHDC